MPEPLVACSAQSLDLGEQLFATAPAADSWLLLEYPRGWGGKALKESDLPPAVKAALESLPRTKVLFIKHENRSAGPYQMYLAREGQLQVWSLPDFDAFLEVSLDDGVVVNDPQWLTCTNSKRDACCARYGLPAHGALQQLAGERAWQCTHVGGHRFAANMACFPHGIFYGRVRVEDVPLLVETSRQGHISLQHYRGRTWYPEPVQAADYFIRRDCGIDAIDGLRYAGHARNDDGTWSVRMAAGSELWEARVSARESPFTLLKSCYKDEVETVTQYRLESLSFS